MLVIIIVVIFALLLIGVYFLGKSGVFNSKASPEQPKTEAENQFSMGQNAYLPVSTWGTFTPNDKTNPYSGSCLNYTAISSTLSLGFPSIDSLNSGSTSYIKSTQECVDPDQILAQAGKHTCVNPNNGSGGTGCITSTAFNYNSTNYSIGDFVPVGTTEGLTPPEVSVPNSNPYYITCGSKVCPGELGLIVPNFTNVFDPSITLSTKPTSVTPSSNYPNCIQNNGVNEPNTGAFYTSLLPCDLSDTSQVFRMVRYSFDDNYTSSVDPAGIYAAIIHRATGFYLAPNMNYLQSINPVTGDFIPNNYTYYFDSLIVDTDISDNSNKYVDLILINPKYDTVRNGIYWLLQNQTPDATKPADAVDPANSLNCNTSYVYPINSKDVPSNCLTTGVPPWYNPCNPNPSSRVNSNENTYTCQGNTDLYIPYSPQQFVYVPNIYLVPKDTTDLIEYWTYLTNQYSIQIGSKSILDPSNWRSVDDAYKGIWNLNITYQYGDIVYYNSVGFYISINGGDNLDNDPTTSPSDWKAIVFDASSTTPSTTLPLILNYKGNWNGATLYATQNISAPPPITNIYKTGDVVVTTSGTFIALQDTPSTSPYPDPSNATYWQQIQTYSSTTPTSFIVGQLFSTFEGKCYVYIGLSPSPPPTSTILPNIFVTQNNVPLLKKFLTSIPADVYYYDNGDSSQTPFNENPFWGSNTTPFNFNVPAPFNNTQYMNPVSSSTASSLYSGTEKNYVVAYITPKLTTNPSGSTPSTFSDTTKLLDSQFVGATNLALQFQSPISVFKDPISYQYKGYNPFNATQ
jgi:hypothetical protein